MVEVFATNVSNKKDAEKLVAALSKHFPDYRINMDLEDCDKILRVQGDKRSVCTEEVIKLVKNEAYEIKPLI
jgi:hypothetical protein